MVYSDVPNNKVYIVNWDGTEKKELASGFGCCVWADPRDGTEWVYIANKVMGEEVDRCQIDNMTVREPVWRGRTSNRFRVSADGKRAGGEFPWSAAGVAYLPNRGWRQYGSGCNSMISPGGALDSLARGHRRASPRNRQGR